MHISLFKRKSGHRSAMLNSREISSFCSQTAMLFQAGITPVEAMSLLLSDVHSADGHQVYQAIYDVCARGDSFTQAVTASGVFPEYVIHTISLGETSGNLDTVMQSLADYYTREQDISDSIREAIRYPFIMIVMMFVVILVLVTKVMPIFQQVFQQLGSEMTGVSLSLLHLGTSISHYSAVFLILLLLLLILYSWSAHSTAGKKCMTAFWRHFAFMRSFYEHIAAERFASGMAMALTSGLDTYQSLDLARQLVNDTAFEDRITKCREVLDQGGTFPEALAATSLFSNFHIRMLDVGWKTGAADTVLRRIADDYDRETTRRIQTLISVIEPTLVIILSLVIGLILLSVILPLLGIMSSIG